jgi:hypothetical protein
MMATQTVSILTVSSRIKEGEFDRRISKVFASKEDARAELKSIEDGNNKDEEHLKNWRARTPIGQIDDLSIELLENNNWSCRYFYSISSFEVN